MLIGDAQRQKECTYLLILLPFAYLLHSYKFHSTEGDSQCGKDCHEEGAKDM